MAYANGKIPTSSLTALSVGGYLQRAAAHGFETMRVAALARDKIVITITSAADAYRTYQIQVNIFLARYVRQATGGGYYGDVRYWNGVRYVRKKGTAAAAVPGTSNHGWGLAVDIKDASGARLAWLRKHAHEFGFNNKEGASVKEPWHWVHDNVYRGSGAVNTGVDSLPLPVTVKEKLMAGTVKVQYRGGKHVVDVGTGTFVHVPNPEYDATLERVVPTQIVLTDREGDVIKDFCARVREQHAHETAKAVKTA